ncbi:MAG: GxxExxY protein [Candidatus Hydrogenedentota bacterium]
MNHETHEIHEKKEKIFLREESYAVQGAIFEVYKEMGCGFLEAVYQVCMEMELLARSIPFQAKGELNLTYKGELLLQKYVPDLICYGQIIVELKAVRELLHDHRAQIMNYLRASGLRLGLLVNFGHYPKVDIERIII